jgi:hypothetical protein
MSKVHCLNIQPSLHHGVLRSDNEMSDLKVNSIVPRECATTSKRTRITSPSARSGSPDSYEIYGLRISSDVPLPIDPTASIGIDGTDVVVRQVVDAPERPMSGDLVGVLRCEHGRVLAARFDDNHDTWLYYPRVATFSVSGDGSLVTLHRIESRDAGLVRLVLACHVLTFVLHRRGTPSLHASAVAIGGESVVFLGPRGRGKSTIAASLLQRGATLLTDDALPLQVSHDGVRGVPSLPLMKVWHETVEQALELDEQLPSAALNTEKKLLRLADRYPFAQHPVPIRAMYVLDRFMVEADGVAEPEIRNIRGHAGLAELLRQTSIVGLLSSTEMLPVLRIYQQLVAQAPVRLLRYPNGFEHQDAVRAAIMADLARQE